MSCPDTNCTDPCNQYDNCGCVNPTTLGCVTYTGLALPCLDVVNGENGNDVLLKIESKACDIGKVKLDADDTCPEYLEDKISAGSNINISFTGTGCDRTMVISATEGGVPVDVNVKVSSDDTTSGYLEDKIQTGTYLTKTVISPAGNEKLKLDLVPATLISTDSGNQLTLGTDGALKTSYSAPDGSETKIVEGTGVEISGTGTIVDPYIISTNPSIQVIRPCFDNVWRNIPLIATGNPSVTYVSGAPQYRYAFDGTIQFKGSATYSVAFGTYQTSNRKYTITIGSLPVTCLILGEQAGVADLKGITYIDTPQASADQITQQYGYIIRKSSTNMMIEFQSSFTNATTKVIVVNFEGAISYPTI